MAQIDKKTILIATPLFSPDVGGPATYSHLLSQELPQRGFTVKILSFGEVRSLPKIIRHFVYGWKVFKLAPNYQIIYAQDPVSVGLPVCLACFFAGRPFTLKIVGDYAWEQGSQRFGVTDFLDDFSLEFGKYSWSVKILKLIETGVAKRAQKIIVPSAYLKKIVSNWGIDKDKIKVVYNAFNPPLPLPEKETLKTELKLEGKIMVSAGRLVPWKGFVRLIELMPELISTFPDLKLFILGDGPDRNLLEDLIIEKKMAEHVFLTGRLSQSELLKFIKASDLFILNTSYEGFSHQLLEVMWCGTPIITTNVGGNPELITDSKNGLLVDYNNSIEIDAAIRKMISTPSFSRELSLSAQKTVTEFGQNRMILGLLTNLFGE